MKSKIEKFNEKLTHLEKTIPNITKNQEVKPNFILLNIGREYKELFYEIEKSKFEQENY